MHRYHPKTLRDALQLVEDFDCTQNEVPLEKGKKPGMSENTRPSEKRGDLESKSLNQTSSSGLTCFWCRKRGHFTWECMVNPCIFIFEADGQWDLKGNHSGLHEMSHIEMIDISLGRTAKELKQDKPTIMADIAGQVVHAILDTRCD